MAIPTSTRRYPTVAILHGGEHDLDQPTEPPDEDDYDEDLREATAADDQYEREIERRGFRD